MKNIQNILNTALEENQIRCDDSAQQKMVQYLHLMQKWNKVFNLTSITDLREMVYLHLIDSLAVAPHLHGKRMLDVGSGAGLPGIPLAILHPEHQWVLLDKNNKKTRFVTQVIAELALTNVTVVHARCENFQASPCFDSILSRAFGTIRLFAETTSHLLCSDGLLIAMKGKFPQTEIDELPDTVTVQKTEEIVIKGMAVERHIICLSKK